MIPCAALPSFPSIVVVEVEGTEVVDVDTDVDSPPMVVERDVVDVLEIEVDATVDFVDSEVVVVVKHRCQPQYSIEVVVVIG